MGFRGRQNDSWTHAKEVNQQMKDMSELYMAAASLLSPEHYMKTSAVTSPDQKHRKILGNVVQPRH